MMRIAAVARARALRALVGASGRARGGPGQPGAARPGAEGAEPEPAPSAPGGGADKSGAGTPAAKAAKLKPAHIALWVGFTQRELGVVKQAVKGFEAKNPGVTVKVVGGINDDKIVAASRGGKAPDVAQSFSA